RLLDLLRRRRPLSVSLFRLGTPVEHALAARAQDHGHITLDLVEELRGNSHATPLTGPAAHLDYRKPAAAREDHLVLPAQIAVDALDQLRAGGPLALDLRGQPVLLLAQRRRFGVALGGETRQLALEPLQLGGGGLTFLHDADQLGLEVRGLFLQQIDLTLGEPELLVVADA